MVAAPGVEGGGWRFPSSTRSVSAPRLMRVRVSDPARLRDLILYLRECGCVAEQASARETEVYLPAIRDARGARMELGIYLTAWRIRNEGVTTEVIT